ncbi:MAG: GNAT family N-acetyltransferase [Gemmatimonadaceae bacterium]|nr:GNAT family N-acetyltransferase [Gloeobacterales cyanobacterium ES-bin-141]
MKSNLDSIIAQSEHIRLRLTTEADLDYVLALEQDQENASFIFRWSREQHRRSLFDENLAHLLIEANPENKKVGFILLAGLNDDNHCFALQRIVVAEKGKGYGRQALQLIKQLVFETWKGHRLWLDVKEHNARARHLYGSEGFVVEGTWRECLRVGETFESLVIMSILSHEYSAE